MAEKPEDFEMRDRNLPPEQDTGGYDETSFDFSWWDDLLSSAPNIQRDVADMRRSYTLDKKIFLRNHLNLRINKTDGPYSREIYDNIELTMNEKRTKVNGLKYKGKKIVVTKGGGGFDYSSANTNEILVREFRELVEKAQLEHAKTADTVIETQLPSTSSYETVEEVKRESLNRLEEYIEDQSDSIETSDVFKNLPPNIQREIRGVFQGGIFYQEAPVETKLKSLDLDKQHWLEMSEKATDEHVKLLYKRVADMEDIQKDLLRIRYNLKPESQVSQNIIENVAQTNDLARFERLKQWLKKNFGTISGVMVGLAGIVAAVVVTTRTYVRKGARAVKSFAKGIAQVAEKVGPLIGAVLGLVAKTLGATATGLTFLSNNLWLLILALFAYLYKKYTDKKYTNKKR